MRSPRPLRRASSRRRFATARVAGVLLVVLAGCGSGSGSDGPTAPAPDPIPSVTALSYTSEPGDWVGQGQTRRYTTADGTWGVYASGLPTTPGNGVSQFVITMQSTANQFDRWALWLKPRPGESLVVGRVYANATRFAFADNGPGLEFTSNGNGCNGVTGQFTVTDLVLGANMHVDRARVVFEQHCDGGPALRGELTIAGGP